MPDNEKLGSAYIEVEANYDKAQAGLEKLRNFVSKRAEAIEKDFKKRKITFDTTLAQKRISELIQLRTKLQQQFDARVKLDMDARSVNQSRKELAAVERQLQGVNLNTEKSVSMFSKFKGVLAGLGLTFGAYKIISFLNESVKAYGEQEQAEKKLEVALGYISKELINYAKAQQKATTYGDEQIIQAEAMIAAFVKDENQIKSLTKATLDFAAAKGIDVVSAANLVAKAMGSSTNALSRYGIQIEGTIGSSERLNSIVNQITSLFGGQAAGAADTYTGKLKQLENEINDLQERLGKDLVEASTDATGAIHGFIGGFESLDDTMRDFNDEGVLGNIITFFENISTMGFDPKQLSGMKKSLKDQIKVIREFQQAVEKASTQNDTWIPPSISNQEPLVLKNKALPTTVGEVKARIDELTKAQDGLEKGSKDYEDNLKEIDDLETSLLSKKDQQKKAEEEANRIRDAANKILDDKIAKIQTELLMADLLNKGKIDLLYKERDNLDLLYKNTTEQDKQLKILQQKKSVDDEIKKIEKEMAAGVYNKLSGMTSQQYAEKIITDFYSRPKGRDQRGEKIESDIAAQEFIKDKKLQLIQDEFERRKAEINAEAEYYLNIYSEAEGKRLGLSQEFADAREKIEEARSLDLLRIDQERYSRELDAISNLGSALQNAFGGAGDSLISKLGQALQIAINVAKAIQASKAGTGSPLDIFSSVLGFVSLFGLSKGGELQNVNGKASYSPHQRIPKFAAGVKNFIVPAGFPNDSFLMGLSSGEKANITPVSEVNRSAAGNDTSLKLLQQISDRVGAVSANVRSLELQVNVINNAPDINTQVRRNKRTENKLARAGMKFNE